MSDTVPPVLITLLRQPSRETEWIEYKHNNTDPEMIGERISALANSAALLEKENAFFVWGLEDATLHVVGTTFKPRRQKKGNEELESWLSHHLAPCPDFRILEFTHDGKSLVAFLIPRATHTPIRWKEIAYIRVGSYTKKLFDYPEKERALWARFSRTQFERRIALEDVGEAETLDLLNYDAYLQLTKQPVPSAREGILDLMAKHKMLIKRDTGRYAITNLGTILFARRLSDFEMLGRKAVRVIEYSGNSRIDGGKEYIADQGYAAVFETLINYIHGLPPNNEHIGQALRTQTEMFPRIAIRELVANAMIHQDFDVRGDSPFVEVFSDRIEITNPGVPLIDTLRFIDEPSESRNEALADFLRRINICEERGSGIDKTISAVEIFQLPPPEFSATERHTRCCLYAYRPFSQMTSKERGRACYQHVCLMYVLNEFATNATLRRRFSLEDDDYKTVTKILAAAVSEKLIKPYDPENRSPRHARYIPFWA